MLGLMDRLAFYDDNIYDTLDDNRTKIIQTA